jgi:hypothetical protein
MGLEFNLVDTPGIFETRGLIYDTANFLLINKTI